MKKIFISAIVVFALQACQNNSSTSENTVDNAQHEATTHTDTSDRSTHDTMMGSMMNDMHAVKLTGDIDLDFANLMIPHHQGAVDMSEKYLAKGQDEKIKAMASKIISSQKTEIDELKTLVANHKASGSGNDHAEHSENEMMQAMMGMMEQMKSVQMIGNADKDFVAMMIPHHQSAVDMAKAELSKGKSAAMKKFAEKVVTDQQKEIVEFKQWLMQNN